MGFVRSSSKEYSSNTLLRMVAKIVLCILKENTGINSDL